MRRSIARGALFAVLGLASAAGCFRHPKIKDGSTLQCLSDDYCLPGWVCSKPPGSTTDVFGVCVKPDAAIADAPLTEPDSGGADAGVALDGWHGIDGVGAVDGTVPSIDGQAGIDGSQDMPLVRDLAADGARDTTTTIGDGPVPTLDGQLADVTLPSSDGPPSDTPITGSGGVSGTAGGTGTITGGATGAGTGGGTGTGGGSGGTTGTDGSAGATSSGGTPGNGGANSTGGMSGSCGTRDCTSSKDGDCSGTPDNQDAACTVCSVGEVKPCATGASGICAAGTTSCQLALDHQSVGWGTCLQNTAKSTRDCSSADDNDCNGMPDNEETVACAVGSTCTTAAGCTSRYCAATGKCTYAASCKELLLADPSLPSGTYALETSGVGWNTYCEMTGDGGSWSLLLKQDGSAQTLAYGSSLWTDDQLLNPDSADLNQVESKLAGYALLPFSQLRIGLAEIGPAAGPPHFVVVSDVHSSLREALQSPANTPFPAPKGTSIWLGMSPAFQLPSGCALEGYNMNGISRLGIVVSASSDCFALASRIGVGGLGVTSAGNVCNVGCATPDLRLPMFAYIMAR